MDKGLHTSTWIENCETSTSEYHDDPWGTPNGSNTIAVGDIVSSIWARRVRHTDPDTDLRITKIPTPGPHWGRINFSRHDQID